MLHNKLTLFCLSFLFGTMAFAQKADSTAVKTHPMVLSDVKILDDMPIAQVPIYDKIPAVKPSPKQLKIRLATNLQEPSSDIKLTETPKNDLNFFQPFPRKKED